MRPIRLAVLIASGALLMSASSVFAAKGSHEQVRVDDTFDEEVCGIAVTTHVIVTGPVNTTSGDRVTDNTRVRVTWTNADGVWLRNDITGQFREVVTDNGDGTITIVDTNRGVHERLRSANGIEAAFDRGQIVFRTVIDLGDPEDPDDDVVVSSDIPKQAGPHPDADADFVLFCEVFQDVLG
jgi:hypothetical protein